MNRPTVLCVAYDGNLHSQQTTSHHHQWFTDYSYSMHDEIRSFLIVLYSITLWDVRTGSPQPREDS
jgi:hypothetical protein